MEDEYLASLCFNNLSDPHLNNLALFGFERGYNERMFSWSSGRSAGSLISPENDPARPPIAGCNYTFVRWRIRRGVENLYFRVLTFMLIIIDLCLVISELVINCCGHPVSRAFRIADLALSWYFLLEVVLRIFALSPKVFFRKSSWDNILDLVVVLLALAASIAAMVVIGGMSEEELYWVEDPVYGRYQCEGGSGVNGKHFGMIVILRFVRVFRFVRLLRLYFDHKNLIKSVRAKISENKRRYQVDGFDLDLTYITTNIIAMSFPSKGTKALYRNKIESVAKFFNSKYVGPDGDVKFRIYNLCSEMEYDEKEFKGDVKRIRIDDHNVPRLSQMWELVEDAQSWLKGGADSRVVALHCKGGKGRTGTMVCALLIAQGLFRDAENSLQYFGQRRTDLRLSKQFQGVETYSQIRYVHYFQKLVDAGMRNIPSRPFRLQEVVISGLRGVGRGDGSDFSLAVDSQGRTELISFASQWGGSLEIHYDRLADRLTVKMIKLHLVIDSDTRFQFKCSSRGVPRGYDDCAFYFWFHTYFMRSEAGGLAMLRLERQHLDNPHKENTWGVWREDFAVEVILQETIQSTL